MTIQGLIDELLQERERPTDLSQEVILAVGPWVEAMPMAIWLDPRLDPYDRSVFGMFWALTKQRGNRAVMPSYEEIMKYGGIRSRDRVARSIATLRITRWITLLHRSRDAAGRHRGNAYLLHCEPVHIADMLELDQEYMRFLRQTATTHRNRGLRALALDVLDEVGQYDQDPTEPPSAADHWSSRLKVMLTSSGQVREMNSDGVQNANLDRVRNSNSDGVRETNSVDSSSNKNTTTPPKPPPSSNTESLGLSPSEFMWPEFLSGGAHENVRELITRKLAELPVEHRQPMLDELAGQMRYRYRAGDPIRSPYGYLRGMVAKFLSGDGGPGGHAESEQRLRAVERQAAERERASVNQAIQTIHDPVAEHNTEHSREAKRRSSPEVVRKYLDQIQSIMAGRVS